MRGGLKSGAIATQAHDTFALKVTKGAAANCWAVGRRRQQRVQLSHPELSAVDPEMSWKQVIKEATDNVEFWLQELQELALLYSQTRGELNPSWVHQQRNDRIQAAEDTRGCVKESTLQMLRETISVLNPTEPYVKKTVHEHINA